MSKSVQKNGVELTLILTNSSIGLWTPDVRFHDAADLNYIVQTIRINASNVIFWSRHTVITLMEPEFEFEKYPSDTQIINIRYGSFAYDQTLFKLNYWGNPISLNQNYDNSSTFMSNPIWTYYNNTANPKATTTYDFYVSTSGFYNSIYHISVTRQGSGIVTRLVLPITLLLILSGLTFWANYENRVDSTITLLLAVSALYIVILSNIPLLGYLTAIDKYVFWMFLLLVLVVALHQTYVTVHDKHETWPLRLFYMRTIEWLGRTAVFPAVILYYLSEITGIAPMTYRLMQSIVITVTIIVFFRESQGVKKAAQESLKNLLTKVNASETKIKDLSI
eukprot:gene36563-45091_t